MMRRSFLPAAAATLAGANASLAQSPASAGRLKQSVCRWCYAKTPIEELAKAAAGMGLQAMDLVVPKEWDAVRKAGLTLSAVPGPSSIPEGLIRKENHAGIEERLRPMLDAAAAAKAYSMIIMAGNRKGMKDEEGAENAIIGLNRIKKYAEDKGILLVLELLNSKVNHADYMADHSAWGVQVVKAVNSPYVKLLYDIYHMQIMEGDVIRTIKDNHQWFGHYHTGGNPGRNELDDTQELNYKAIAKAVADTGYQGYFAHEFLPTRDPLTSLKQAVEICKV